MKLRQIAIGLPLVASLALAHVAIAAGTYLSSGGPVSQSMGGASTAAPVDAIGATYWNPASISGMPEELGVGLGFLVPNLETSSSIPGVASGTTEADPGATPLPTVGWIFRRDDSPLTIGLGLHAIAGYRTNYPASDTNPLFLPQSNVAGLPGGLGRVFTGAEFLQIAPMASLALTDRLSIGAGPTVTVAQLFFDPFLAAAPDDSDASGAARYGPGRGTRTHWGGGVQIGIYYISPSAWHFGASLKSPQWMEAFHFHSEDELGRSREGRVDLDLPMILSVGTAYSGLPNWVFALDARYYDFKNTDGFGPHGFRPDGSFRGLGQSSVVEVGVGVQRQLTERTLLRAGYTFNQNPYQDAEATFAALAPLFYQHQIHLGATRFLSQRVALNVAYSYWPETRVSGPLLTPAGPVPGGRVSSRLDAHHATFGVAVRY